MLMGLHVGLQVATDTAVYPHDAGLKELTGPQLRNHYSTNGTIKSAYAPAPASGCPAEEWPIASPVLGAGQAMEGGW